jgi:hypothetical protein
MDPSLKRFLEAQRAQGLGLASESDILELLPLDLQHFVARFRCKGLVQGADGQVLPGSRFDVAIWFPEDYRRRVEPMDVVTWLAPREAFHPNLLPPLVCLGHVTPGTPLVDLLYRTYELITYENVTMTERDALNPAACRWARRNQDLFPLDARPLKWRSPGAA